MSRDEALVAVLNAARALRATWPVGVRGSSITVLLSPLYAAIDAVDAVGAQEVTTTALFWCAAPECFRVNDTAGVYCYQCSELAKADQVRAVMRDDVFRDVEKRAQ